MMRFLALAAVACCAAPAIAQTPPPSRPEVLVLGVYHMASPGRDIFNSQAEDVLAPKRQAEIEALVEALARFRPTKVAVEADPWNGRVDKDYAAYLAGTHELTRNEVEQIGFRLAKRLGHAKVHAIDVDGEFPYARLMDYAKAHDRAKEMDALTAEIGSMVKEQDAFRATHTVLETLLAMNSDEHVARDVGFYYRQGAIGEPGNWAGADLLADWYRRNIRIYSNVAGLATAPDDRVLVIFGAGHLGWLQQDIANHPGLRLRKLREFVP